MPCCPTLICRGAVPLSPVTLPPGCDLQRGGSAATGRLRFWELLGVFWEFLREARRFSARFWLRLSAQQHPHLNRTRKSQLTLSNTSAPSASLSCPQQYLSAISCPVALPPGCDLQRGQCRYWAAEILGTFGSFLGFFARSSQLHCSLLASPVGSAMPAP